MARNRERLSTPLIRTEAEVIPATWDEALSAAAAGFSAIRDKLGGDGFAAFSCSKATNETNYMAQKFARVVMGSNNVDSCNRT